MNTNTQMYDCGVHRNHSLALLFAIPSFFTTIGSDTMRILQNKIPVIVQSTQPKRWTKQQLQQSMTNRHVIHDTVLRDHLFHRITSTITTFILLVSNLHGNVNEPYGRVVHPTNDDRSKVDRDDQDRPDSTNGPQVAATSSGGDGGDDDDEDDPFNRKLHNNECGGDESLTGPNDADQGDEEENGFHGEVVEVTGTDDPDNFPNVDFDDDMEIDEDDMVEVGAVDETEEEDMVGLSEE